MGTNQRFVEDLAIEGVRLTTDGYLVGSIRCARTGIQHYNAYELGLDGADVIAVYRPDSAVFNKDSLRTFVGKPVTDNHPSVMVTAENWKQYAVGSIGEEVLRDGEYLRVPITIMDADTIKSVEDGKREVSVGYFADYRFEDGVTPEGEPYQAIQENIRGNHLAIVDRGRAGRECRIGDSAGNWGAAPITNNKDDKRMSEVLKTVVVDGLSVKTTDQGAEAITKLQSQLKDADALIQTAEQEGAQALAAKDKELAARDAEIVKLKGEALDAEALDALVKERADFISKASQLVSDEDFTGMSNDDIMKAVVTKLNGAESIDGKSKDYIAARFDIALDDKDNKIDPVRDAFRKAPKTVINDNGQSAYEKRISDSWKGSN